MAKRINSEMIDIENPEWTAEDFRRAGSASEVLPADFVSILPKRRRGQRGAQRTPIKQQVTLRLDAAVLEFFKTTGRGWQTRINEALKHVVADSK